MLGTEGEGRWPLSSVWTVVICAALCAYDRMSAHGQTRPAPEPFATHATLQETVEWLEDRTGGTVSVMEDDTFFRMKYQWHDTCLLHVTHFVGTRGSNAISVSESLVPMKTVRRISQVTDTFFSIFTDPKEPWWFKTAYTTGPVLGQNSVSKLDLYFNADREPSRIRAAVTHMAGLCGAKIEGDAFYARQGSMP